MKRRTFLQSIAMLTGGTVLRPIIVGAENHPLNVYLTFNGGPLPNRDFTSGPTDVLLNILRDNGAVATFFLYGASMQEWHGPLLLRYLYEGHAIGNSLLIRGTNTVSDHTSSVQLAYNWFLAEDRILGFLSMTDKAAYDRYVAQAKLFRRPGGSDTLAVFLTPEFSEKYAHNTVLKHFQSWLPLLKGVYDYSGWHLDLEGANLPANNVFLSRHTANQGLIVQIDETDITVGKTLPRLLTTMNGLGAQFHTLPRPIDQPNTMTVGLPL